jgi:hypothetical protein
MLDIGGDTGALVVYAAPLYLGHEIEMRAHGGMWAGVHTAVRARHVGDTVLYAGVFGSLPAGRYDLRVRHGRGHSHRASMGQTVTVNPGAVTETTLTGSPPDRPAS